MQTREQKSEQSGFDRFEQERVEFEWETKVITDCYTDEPFAKKTSLVRVSREIGKKLDPKFLSKSSNSLFRKNALLTYPRYASVC